MDSMRLPRDAEKPRKILSSWEDSYWRRRHGRQPGHLNRRRRGLHRSDDHWSGLELLLDSIHLHNSHIALYHLHMPSFGSTPQQPSRPPSW